MRSNAKNGSLRGKILIIMIPIIVVSTIISGIVSVGSIRQLSGKVINRDLDNGYNNAEKVINGYFVGLGFRLDTIGKTEIIQKDIKNDKSENIISILKGLKGATDVIIRTFVLSDNKSYSYPDASRDSLVSEDLYKRAMKNGIAYGGPYIDSVTGTKIVTVVQSFNEGDKPVGVVGMNIDLKDISVYLSEQKFSNTGYHMLLSKDGDIISNGINQSTYLSKFKNENILRHLTERDSGTEREEMNGEEYAYRFGIESELGWKIVSFISTNEYEKEITDIVRNQVIIFIAILIASIFIITMFANNISKRLKNIMDVMSKAGSGDLDVEVSVEDTDEISQMGKAFNNMIKEFKSIIKETSSGTDKLNNHSTQFVESFGSLTESANQISSSMMQMSYVANEQSIETDKIYEKMENFSMEIDEITLLISEMYKVCESTEVSSEKGLDIVNSLVKGSTDTTRVTQAVNRSVKNISNESNEVENIVIIIKDIADKTNLLALNASIEAARAGEFGRGFAVVAEEIRKLAEQSKSATENISYIIGNMQDMIKDSVSELDGINEVINVQNRNVEETKISFVSIFEGIADLNDKIKNIEKRNEILIEEKSKVAESIRNLSATVEENLSSTQEVTASTEEQLSIMEELQKASSDIIELNRNLKELIGKFKL